MRHVVYRTESEWKHSSYKTDNVGARHFLGGFLVVSLFNILSIDIVWLLFFNKQNICQNPHRQKNTKAGKFRRLRLIFDIYIRQSANILGSSPSSE